MIDAKNKFREGFIKLKRPFEFDELESPIQKFTILWAYSEKPLFTKSLTEKARERISNIDRTSYLGSSFFEAPDRKEKEIEKVIYDQGSYDEIYKGDVVQCFVEGKMCRFFPDEYSILTMGEMSDTMQEEGYHVICNPSIYSVQAFKDRAHYIQSRGIDSHIAKKWAGLYFKDLVVYKPYYEVLLMFCRPHEIIPDDPFYIEVEGIDFTSLKEQRREYFDSRCSNFILSLKS
jgi:hypothetical protein